MDVGTVYVFMRDTVVVCFFPARTTFSGWYLGGIGVGAYFALGCVGVFGTDEG